MSSILSKSWTLPLTFFLVTGCVAPSKGQQINVETRNYTKEMLSEVEVWFGNARCSSGYLVADGQKTELFYPYPITETARVLWKDATGKSHEVTVNLTGVYKAGQSGVLEIGITDVGVVPKLKPPPTPPR